jgi:hypothetical protein
MPNKTFGGFADEIDTGFERNQTVQSGVKAVKQGAQSVVKQVVQQVKPSASDFFAQLIGLSTPSGEEQGIDDQGNPVQKPQQQGPQQQNAQSAAPSNTKPQPTPEQQKQNEKSKMFNDQYGGQFKLEEELKKEREQQKQKIQEHEQEEAAELDRKAQEEQAKMSDIETPGGKKTGMQAQRSKKASMPMRRMPVAVERAKTKAEMNRGTTG